MTDWCQATVINNHRWTEKLFSLTLSADIEQFVAGQFTKLALTVNDKRQAAAYSFVNAPDDNVLEFYLIEVPNGRLSPALMRLELGDTLEIAKQASGFFTLDDVPKSKQLWMLATGTAIGPYLSILQEQQVWRDYQTIVLVHAVRHQSDLSYQPLIKVLCRNPQLRYVSIVSRESNAAGLTGRIPALIANGDLAKFANLSMSPVDSQFMICGNPEMVRDTSQVLLDKGYQRNRRSKPGHITIEQYWSS